MRIKEQKKKKKKKGKKEKRNKRLKDNIVFKIELNAEVVSPVATILGAKGLPGYP